MNIKLSDDVAALNPQLTAKALAKLDTDGYKSELERRCAREWIPMQGPIGWVYEPFSVRLGKKVSYTPDFIMWFLGLRMPCVIEVKGYTPSLRADKMRFELAREKLPCFAWCWLTWDHGWIEKWG